MLLYRQKLLIDGVGSVHGAVLGQIPQGLTLGQGDSALIRRHLPHQDAQQGGLPCAVYAYDGRFFVIFYMEADICQHPVLQERFAYVVARQYHCSILSPVKPMISDTLLWIYFTVEKGNCQCG